MQMIQRAGETVIYALATALGQGAIATIRISGNDCCLMIDKVFKPAKKGTSLVAAHGHTLHFGRLVMNELLIDEVLISVFKAPRSYTGEEMIEISCHGSVYIQQTILNLLAKIGARPAEPGEFTLRAFLNGKMDLTQAEGVADLISSRSEAEHKIALNQMRGGFSRKLAELRSQLVDLASYLELELDFSEEDVEFADRTRLKALLNEVKQELIILRDSFQTGNVIRQGIPVAIAGRPNVGKSTLLNVLLNDERAIVSDIPGTTRDTVEDTLIIEGLLFRFIDTAGLRHTQDTVEQIGIERTYMALKKAAIILWLFDITEADADQIKEEWLEMREMLSDDQETVIIPVANKTDQLIELPRHLRNLLDMDPVYISARKRENIALLIDRLKQEASRFNLSGNLFITNNRHLEAIERTLTALDDTSSRIEEDLPTDLVADALRHALKYMGEITGEVYTDEILGNIFSKFCIGK